MIDWRWVAEGWGGRREPPVLFQPHQAPRQLGSRPLEQLECPQPSPARSVGLSREPGESHSANGACVCEPCEANCQVRAGCDGWLWLAGQPSIAACHWSEFPRGSAREGGARRPGPGRESGQLRPRPWHGTTPAQFLSSLLVDLSEA